MCGLVRLLHNLTLITCFELLRENCEQQPSTARSKKENAFFNRQNLYVFHRSVLVLMFIAKDNVTIGSSSLYLNIFFPVSDHLDSKQNNKSSTHCDWLIGKGNTLKTKTRLDLTTSTRLLPFLLCLDQILKALTFLDLLLLMMNLSFFVSALYLNSFCLPLTFSSSTRSLKCSQADVCQPVLIYRFSMHTHT